MSPNQPQRVVVIGMVGWKPERFLAAIPADASDVYIVTRQGQDDCAESVRIAKKRLEEERSIIAKERACDIFDMTSAFRTVDLLMREAQRSGARVRVVIGTGTNPFAAVLVFVASTQGAEIYYVAETKEGEEARGWTMEPLPLPIQDREDEFEDYVLAFNLIEEADSAGKPLSVAQLKTKLKRAAKPARAFPPGKRNARSETALINSFVDKLGNGYMERCPADPHAPHDPDDLLCTLSQLGKRLQRAYGHRVPSGAAEAAATPEAEAARARSRRRGAA